MQTQCATFEGVSGVKIEGMSCRRDGNSVRVTCAGRIVADYGAEKNEFPFGAYIASSRKMANGNGAAKRAKSIEH